MAKDFSVGELVWAKMKGFSPWPAKISRPPDGSSTKSKNPQHFVFFFGTHNVAWILDELIVPHSEEMLTNSDNYKKMPNNLKTAIEEIKEESLKGTPKSKNPIKRKGKKDIPRSKCPELDSIRSTSKAGKKSPPEKKIEKKRPKKRPISDDDQGSNSSKAKDYPQLKANYLPKYTRTDIECIPSYDGQLVLASLMPPFLEDSSDEDTPKKALLPSKKKVGFIGLGAMGSQMVRNLLKLKNIVTVWNRNIGKCEEFVKLGAHKAETPADLVRACDIIFCCVSDSEAVKSLFSMEGGVIEGFSGGGSSKALDNKGYVEMTSIDPTTAQESSEAICGAGGKYLEALMIGSRQKLLDSAILIIAAGDRHLFRDCDRIFNVWATHVSFLGSDMSSASTRKLLTSKMIEGTYAEVSKGLQPLVKKCGIPPMLFMEALADERRACHVP